MPVEVYKGRFFQYGHERRALGIFLQELINRFEDSEELFIVVSEVDVNGANIDLLLLSNRVVIVAELKELTAAAYKAPDQIQLRGKENGPWEYIFSDEGRVSRLGGARNKNNPYKQVEQIRHDFAEWLSVSMKEISNASCSKRSALDKIHGWVVVSPGFDGQTDQLALPWNDIRNDHNWFQVLPAAELAWQFNCTSSSRTKFTANELHHLVSLLGAEKITNLAEVVPEFHPRRGTDADSLFSRLAALPQIFGRQAETRQLLDWIEDPVTSTIAIEGMGGVGKTTLLRHLIAQPRLKRWQIKHVSCKEKEFSLETFLNTVAEEIPDQRKANFISPQTDAGSDWEVGHNQRLIANLQDRLETALDYLESLKTILILDDFQKIADPASLEPFFLRLPVRSSGLKCILASREHPAIIDHPDLFLQVARRLSLMGLKKPDVAAMIADRLPGSDLKEITNQVYKKTSGNPYLVGLLLPIIERTGWSEFINSLPLYKNDRSHWFDSLIETLDPSARLLAVKLSVLNSAIPQDLIPRLCPGEGAGFTLTQELVDCFILQRSASESSWTMADSLREYLIDHYSTADMIQEILLIGVSYFMEKAAASNNGYSRASLLFRALMLYQRLDMLDRFPRQDYDVVFRHMKIHGDIQKARQVAVIANTYSMATSAQADHFKWLLQLALLDFDNGDIQTAQNYIQEVTTSLSSTGLQRYAIDDRELIELRIQLAIVKGRVAYHQAEYGQAGRLFDEALNLANVIKDPALQADCLMRLARLERLRGNLELSKSHFLTVKNILSVHENQRAAMEVLTHLGLIARSEKDNKTAHRNFSRASRMARRLQDLSGYEINRSLLADLARRSGDFKTAARIFKECLDISLKLGSGIAIRVNMGQLAECLIQLGRLKEAHSYLTETQNRCQRAGDQIGIAWNYRRRGLYLKKMGDIHAGDAWIQKGINKLQEIGSPIYIDEFKKDLGPEQGHLPGFQEPL